MKLEEHERVSLEHFGKKWTEVHCFLDQFFPMFRGADHRRILHTVEGVNEVVRRFGEEARPVAELHIKDDWRGYCGLYEVPSINEIDADDWLFMTSGAMEVQDEILKGLLLEKLTKENL